MGFYAAFSLLALLIVPLVNVDSRPDFFLRLPSDGRTNGGDDAVGTRWAVLIAGSNGYGNYRHQVYQLFFFC